MRPRPRWGQGMRKGGFKKFEKGFLRSQSVFFTAVRIPPPGCMSVHDPDAGKNMSRVRFFSSDTVQVFPAII